MTYPIWTKGLALGVLAAIPTGPVGLLCVKKTLFNGRIAGFVSAIGLACANTLAVFIILHGLSLGFDFLQKNIVLFQLFFGVLLCYAGIKEINNKKLPVKTHFYSGYDLAKDFMATFLAVLTSPVTFFRYSIIFAFIGLVKLSPACSSEVALFVFLGILATWVILTQLADNIRRFVNERLFKHMRKFSGVFLIGIGILIIVNMLIQYHQVQH